MTTPGNPEAHLRQAAGAWPNTLQPYYDAVHVLGEDSKAGVVVHCPPLGQADNPATPEAPIPGVSNVRLRWMNTNFI
jgi:hypothetical protein